MQLIAQEELDEPCHGWDGETVFRLRNGEVWQQAAHRQHRFFQERPLVRIWKHGNRHLLEMQGIREVLPVNRLYC